MSEIKLTSLSHVVVCAGFGLLESGLVSKKDEVNIMMKNAIDVIVGGLSFWLFGYAFSFGDGVDSLHGFSGGNRFMLMASAGDQKADEGSYYARFFFQSSFATTATTIVSGEKRPYFCLELLLLQSKHLFVSLRSNFANRTNHTCGYTMVQNIDTLLSQSRPCLIAIKSELCSNLFIPTNSY